MKIITFYFHFVKKKKTKYSIVYRLLQDRYGIVQKKYRNNSRICDFIDYLIKSFPNRLWIIYDEAK